MPDRSDVRRAVALFRNPADYFYFFSKLISPGWLTPLLEEGRYSSPPSAEREGDTIRFPGWPESAYLARVAARASEVAATVLRSIPLPDNHNVHVDLVETALQVPATDAAEWSKREVEWVSRQEWLAFVLPEKLAELAAYLLAHDQVETGLELAGALLSLRPDPRWRTAEGEQRPTLLPHPATKMDGWEYREVVHRLLPALPKHGGLQALELVSNLLVDAVRLSSPSDEAEPPVDYSFIWRDAIEERDGDGGDVRDTLVEAIRDVAVELAAIEGCDAVVACLRAREWHIFNRLALHTIRVACGGLEGIAREELFRPGAFTDPSIHHEYVLLLRDSFPSLSPADQARILSVIQAGPDRDAMRRRHREYAGEDPKDEEVAAWVEHWQRDRLSPLAENLSPEWRATFDALVQRHGPPEFDYVQHKTSGGWVGEPSPMTPEEINTVSAEELREFLRRWEPEGGIGKPTRYGITQNISALDAEYFAAESAHAASWHDLHAEYVAAFLGGLQKAVRAKAPLHWGAILDLSEMLSERRGADEATKSLKMAVAELFITACNSDEAAPPIELAPRVTRVVQELLDRAVQDGDESSSADGDYLNRASVSASGKALEAAIRAAIWVKRTEVGAHPAEEWKFDARLPQLAATLRGMADSDSSFPVYVRAEFGAQLGPLVWLDRAWVTALAPKLLPESEGRLEHRKAVWDTYLAYGHPYGVMLDVFRAQYAWTVGRLAADEAGVEGRRSVAYRLAEHLMTYYWQGALPHPDKKGLLRQFFKAAELRTRRYAIEFVGRTLRKSGEIPEEPLALLRNLVQWRISVVQQKPDGPSRAEAASELSEFGWWFGSGKFAPDWALRTLLTILRLGGGIESHHQVAGELLRRVGQFPIDVGEAVRLMVQQSRPEFTAAGWRQELRDLLAILRVNDNQRVRSFAAATVDILLSRGLDEYRELMPA